MSNKSSQMIKTASKMDLVIIQDNQHMNKFNHMQELSQSSNISRVKYVQVTRVSSYLKRSKIHQTEDIIKRDIHMQKNMSSSVTKKIRSEFSREHTFSNKAKTRLDLKIEVQELMKYSR
ncbi:hypothetical protein Dimus_039317 [Dionaea muscipula]